MAKQKITLMNKNTPILEFMGEIVIYQNENDGPKGMPYYDAEDFKYLNKELCPLSILHDENSQKLIKTSFNEWFKKRSMSRQRNDITVLKISFDGSPNFFSMTDQYWFKTTDLDTWDNLNFFTNLGDDTIGKIAFSKNLANIPELTASLHSPDLTTNGVAKKIWIQEKIKDVPLIKSYLLKSARTDFSQGVISEILASKFLSNFKKINPNMPDFVSYSLDIYGYELCSKCKNFLYPNIEFIPAKEIYASVPIKGDRKDVYDHLIDAVEYYEIPDAKEFIDWMIIVDRYLLNYDRHLGNFGFLRDVETGEFKGPAPLFDFGNAFFTDSEKYQSKILSKREDYLFEQNRIAPMTKEMLSEMNDCIKNCDLLDKQSKDNVYINICKNNNYVKERYISGNAITEKVKGKPAAAFSMDNF